MSDTFLLSAIIFLPAIGALALLLFQSHAEEAMRQLALLVTVLTFFFTIVLAVNNFDPRDGGIQPVAKNASGQPAAIGDYENRGVSYSWISNWNIDYRLGYDGISVPLVLLTGLISMLAMLASWSIKKQVQGYLILFLLLETGMMGVFLALDFFLFYVFWEVMLLPMYFLIGIWGGPRREYA